MSYQFSVIAMFATTKPAAAINHDGEVITLSEYPVGTIFAVDKAGHLFVHVGPIQPVQDWRDQYGRSRRPSQLMFRDYWRWVMAPEALKLTKAQRVLRMSPVGQAVLNSGFELVYGVDGYGIAKDDE